MGIGMPNVAYVPDGPLGSGTLYTLNYSYHVKPTDPNGDAIISGQLQFYIPSKTDMNKGMGGLYMVSSMGRRMSNDGNRSLSGDDLIPINVDLLAAAVGGFPNNSSIAEIFNGFGKASGANKFLAVLEGIKTVVDHDKFTESQSAFLDEVQKMADKRGETNTSEFIPSSSGKIGPFLFWETPKRIKYPSHSDTSGSSSTNEWGGDSMRTDKRIPSKKPTAGDTIRSVIYPKRKK
jgi:hypothetical protein